MRYLLGFLITIGLIVFVIILIIKGFSTSTPPQKPLTDYTDTTDQVVMTVDGPEVGDLEHQGYRISVNNNQVELEVLNGYQPTVTQTKTYENNPQSFYVFLRALDFDGFTKGVANASASANDERGVCATGDRYIFEIANGSSDIQRYWSTSCGGQGTFKGSRSAIELLFQDQIPPADFNSIVGQLNL